MRPGREPTADLVGTAAAIVAVAMAVVVVTAGAGAPGTGIGAAAATTASRVGKLLRSLLTRVSAFQANYKGKVDWRFSVGFDLCLLCFARYARLRRAILISVRMPLACGLD